MKYLIALLALWFLAVVSVAGFSYVKVLGVTPDLVLIFAAAWTVVRGQDEGFVVVPLAGLLRDLATSDPLGTSVLALSPVVLIAAAIRLRAIESEFVPAVAVVALASFAYGVISMWVLAATGQEIQWADAFVTVVLPSIVVNALFTPILFLPLYWFGSKPAPSVMGRITSPL